MSNLIDSAALLIFTNLPDQMSARTLARQLIEQRHAACVNVLPVMHSVYRWQNAVEEAEEVTLVIKTTRDRYAQLERAIQLAHPYDVPEIIAVPITHGLPAYLNWIAQQTKEDDA